jgi:hypothetical protein
MSCEEVRITMAKMLDELVPALFENNLIRQRMFQGLHPKEYSKNQSDFDN